MPPWKLSSDAVKTILPCPRATMPGADRPGQHERRVRLTSSTRSHASSRCSAAGARAMVPALLTRMSTGRPSAAEPRDQPADRVAVGEVGGHRPEAAARGPRPAHAPGCRVGLELVALTPTTSAPAARQRLRHRQADAAPGAGDDGEPTGQVERRRPLDGGRRRSCRPPAATVDQDLHHAAAALQRREGGLRVARAARSAR